MPVTKVPEKVIEGVLKTAKRMGNGLYGVDLKEKDNPNIDYGLKIFSYC